jgi:hypothetical protein
MEHMTKTQQKLARQATIFLNCGGKALTALLRMLLLSVATVFEGVSKAFLFMDNSIEQDARDAERAQEEKSSQVCAITFSALSGGKRSPLDEAFAHNSAPAFTATAAGRGHHA